MKTAIWMIFIIVAVAENQKQISKRCLSYTQNDARTRARTVIFRQLTAVSILHRMNQLCYELCRSLSDC